jgi:hypothetical protein
MISRHGWRTPCLAAVFPPAADGALILWYHKGVRRQKKVISRATLLA